MEAPRILFAAPKSGSGKTMITCGIIELLKRRGKRVASFKCGPDYIDPMFHRQVLGIPSGNLDTYFTDAVTTRFLFMEKAKHADITVLEGVMGFYDGLAGTSFKASTYEVSKVTETPVILIVDGKGASLTLASVICGIKEFRKDSGIVGVILNRVSPGYYEKIAKTIRELCDVKMLGYVPDMKNCQVPSRNLGLVSPQEVKDFELWIKNIADTMEQTIDIDALTEIAVSAVSIDDEFEMIVRKEERSDIESDNCGLYQMLELPDLTSSVRIGIAKDEAFSFYYSENLELLKRMGAQLVEFSPVHDKKLPPDIQGLVFGGGYPEIYGRQLWENTSMREAVKIACEKIPVLAECGGFLYLQQNLEACDGQVYPMVGVLKGEGYRRDTLSRFGYMQCVSKEKGLSGAAGTVLKGHEFHYWDSRENGKDFLAGKPVPEKMKNNTVEKYNVNYSYECIVQTDKMLAGFPHFYYYSNPVMIYRFLKKCGENKEV